MPAFTYPSSVPSTPGSEKRTFSSQSGQHPSTTPAGPPPSSAKSFTPAGIPSSILFPSSKSSGGPQKNQQSKPPPTFTFGNGQKTQGQTKTTQVRLNDFIDEDQDADGDEDMDAEYPTLGDADDDMNFDDAYDWNSHEDVTRPEPGGNALQTTNRAINNDASQLGISLMDQHESALSAAVKSLVKTLGQPELTESDQLILQTESQVNKMYDEHASTKDQEQILARALKIVPEALCKVWQNCCNDVGHSTDEDQSIGPLNDDPPVYKAAFVGGFLLLLNHPPARIIQPPQRSRMSIDSKAVAIATSEAYPKALVDWLNKNHNPYRSALPRLQKVQPNPTASNNFWDLVLSNTLRGQIGDVAALLANSDFQFAASAKDDGSPTKGYKDSQLRAASLVVGRAAARLQACPALQSGDWNVTDTAWISWRLGIEEEMSELIRTAEGEDQASEYRSSFEAENFGISTNTRPLSKSTRKAHSKVPWTVYENLKSLYNILLGSPSDVINLAQDWLEASLALAIWWNGSDSEELELSTSGFRQSYSNDSRTRMVDVDVVKAYRQRLMVAFETVSQEQGLAIDQYNPVEVALASVLEGNISDVFSILRTWSIPITSAIMEVGTEAQWFESVHTEMAPDIFDESDLMVLSYARPEQPISKDSVLVEYAKMLLDRAPLYYGDQEVEGWELAIELIGRIDNTTTAIKTAQEIIKSIAITDDNRADRVISICNQYDLYREAAEIAEKYGDTIPETTGSYGTALVYYARAHNVKKVKDVLDLLISYCLVQSTAFPATEKLDSHLSDLLHNPKDTLTDLASNDQEAAEILSAQFSGYATIRKFYDIRDGAHPNTSSFASLDERRKLAAAALLTAIQSAGDNIQGGLYDAEHPAVIPVDGLLTLLGEASVFVNQTPRILSLSQLLILLRTIEDLNAVHSRIKAQCAEFFSSTLAAANGAAQPDPRELMKKSISDLTASSAFSQSTGFSLLGGSIMGSGVGSSYADIATTSGTNSSGSKDTRKKGWDWRQGYGRDTKPGKLIKKLRLALAEEVGSAWIEDSI